MRQYLKAATLALGLVAAGCEQNLVGQDEPEQDSNIDASAQDGGADQSVDSYVGYDQAVDQSDGSEPIPDPNDPCQIALDQARAMLLVLGGKIEECDQNPVCNEGLSTTHCSDAQVLFCSTFTSGLAAHITNAVCRLEGPNQEIVSIQGAECREDIDCSTWIDNGHLKQELYVNPNDNKAVLLQTEWLADRDYIIHPPVICDPNHIPAILELAEEVTARIKEGIGECPNETP